ncbi:MAG: hypothetical protein AMXMBFR84_07980 [Candidatus Hydrogenedentota bacterium]
MDAPSRAPKDTSSAHVPHGHVFIIPNRCKGCKFCVEFCPTHVLDYSAEINAKGYHYPVIAEGKELACVHCNFCDLVCPEMAIFTREGDATAVTGGAL